MNRRSFLGAACAAMFTAAAPFAFARSKLSLEGEASHAMSSVDLAGGPDRTVAQAFKLSADGKAWLPLHGGMPDTIKDGERYWIRRVYDRIELTTVK